MSKDYEKSLLESFNLGNFMSFFILKLIAVVCMLLDHVALFIPDMPIWFHWLGRLAGPIFIFGVVNSMEHTHSQTEYIFRLYLLSIIVSIFQAITDTELNVIRCLFSLALIIYILEMRENKEKWLKIYILYQVATIIVLAMLCSIFEGFCLYTLPALLGSIFAMEGGLIWVIFGLIFYKFKHDKRKLAVCYILMVILYELCLATDYVNIIFVKIASLTTSIIHGLFNVQECLYYISYVIFGFDAMNCGGNIFFEQYQWMMIFSLPLLLLYNQKQGKKLKYFFYVFYPLHICILWILDNLFWV